MADGVINRKVQPKQTKAMDMCFCWLQDKECQENFDSIGNQENSSMRTIEQSTI